MYLYSLISFVCMVSTFLLISMMPAGAVSVPVIVMADDSDPNSVVRSSDVFDRVIEEVKAKMKAYDFRIIGEQELVAELQWNVRDRRPRSELAQTIDVACTSQQARLCPRALVALKIVASAEDLGFAKKGRIAVRGNIHDAQTNQFLGGWDGYHLEFPMPAQCDQLCLERMVGDKARDIAASVGDVLRRRLARETEATAGLVNEFRFNFRDFGFVELRDITREMETNFKGFVEVRGTSGDANSFYYTYATSASAYEVMGWLQETLTLKGLSEDDVYMANPSQTEIRVERLN